MSDENMNLMMLVTLNPESQLQVFYEDISSYVGLLNGNLWLGKALSLVLSSSRYLVSVFSDEFSWDSW